MSSNFASGPGAARGVLVSALAAQDAVQRLRRLDDAGYFAAWMPEVEGLKGVGQPKEHYWDVYHHSLETVAAMGMVVSKVLPGWHSLDLQAYLEEEVDDECSRLLLLKLAALLHDIAKPQTKSFEPGGRMRFFGHAQVGAQVASSLMERLEFSVVARNAISLMVENHLRPGQLTREDGGPSKRALDRFFRDTNGFGIETLLLNLADHRAMRGPMLTEADWRQHVERTKEIIEDHLAEQQAPKPPKLVDGFELMSKFGLKAGPLVGEILSAVKEAQARGEIKTSDEALALAEKFLKDRHRSLSA